MRISLFLKSAAKLIKVLKFPKHEKIMPIYLLFLFVAAVPIDQPKTKKKGIT